MNTTEKRFRAARLRCLARCKQHPLRDAYIAELTRQMDTPADPFDEAYFRELEEDIKAWPDNRSPAPGEPLELPLGTE